MICERGGGWTQEGVKSQIGGVRFHSKNNRRPMKDFKQGRDLHGPLTTVNDCPPEPDFPCPPQPLFF